MNRYRNILSLNLCKDESLGTSTMLRLDLVSTSVSMIVLIVLVGISTDNKVIHATLDKNKLY